MKECSFKPKVIGFKYDNTGLPRSHMYNQDNYKNNDRSNSDLSKSYFDRVENRCLSWG